MRFKLKISFLAVITVDRQFCHPQVISRAIIRANLVGPAESHTYKHTSNKQKSYEKMRFNRP